METTVMGLYGVIVVGEYVTDMTLRVGIPFSALLFLNLHSWKLTWKPIKGPIIEGLQSL